MKYKLYEAVKALATGSAPIQRRLFNAGLILGTSSPEDFTHSEDGERFAGIMAALNGREASGEEGTLEATTSQLADAEAEHIAAQIVELDTVCRPLD
ncbi:MAG: hypothetical protein ACTHK3_02215 [Solirubrobacterales bacterium]